MPYSGPSPTPTPVHAHLWLTHEMGSYLLRYGIHCYEKETRLYSEKHDKKIKNIREVNENGSLFLRKILQYRRSVILKVLVIFFLFKI